MPDPALDDRPLSTRDHRPAGEAFGRPPGLPSSLPSSGLIRPADLPDRPLSFDPAPAGEVRAPAATSGRRWPFRIEFTGSGSEYFRIWLVNLLMTLVTLGAYHPRAQVRRYQYFRTNTWVVFGNGERHAMDFEVGSGKSVRVIGFWMALVVASFILYAIAPGLIGLVVLVATPWLRLRSLRYRIVGTTFRGLRFRFTATLGGYLAVWWPMLVLGGIVIMQVAQPGSLRPARSIAPALLLTILAGLAMWPWIQWRLLRWRQQHLAYGGLAADRYRTPLSQVYFLALKTALLVLLGGAGAFGALMLAGVFQAGAVADVGGRISPSLPASTLALGAILLLAAVLLFIGVHFNTALHNLAWGGTAGDKIRLRSRLSHWRMAGLMLKSWILTVLTLGLYRPFAEVALARLRLESVDGILLEDPDLIVAAAHQQAGAMGDLAADLFDIGDSL